MSGFEGQSGWYGLTPTKARYWHRYRTDCECRSIEDIVTNHLGAFEVQDKGSWWRITGPGLREGWTGELYEAISGNVGAADRSPERQWRY